MRVSSTTLLLFACASLLWACGSEGETRFGLGDTNAVVSSPGDQLHPYLDGQTLVWFDLGPDPDGVCYGQNSGDGLCQGEVRSLELNTRVMQTLTGIMEGDVVPATSDGLVVWRSWESGDRGLSIVAQGSSRIFRPGLGCSANGSYENSTPPVVDQGEVFWVDYDYELGNYLIMGGDLRSGDTWTVLSMVEYPMELQAFGGYLAWVVGRRDNDGYQYQLEMMGRDSGARTGVVETEEPIFGLGGYGHWLSWKQGWVGTDSDLSELHVYLRREDGRVERIDSDEAWVSAETNVAVGSDSLVWIDYRRGGYAVAAWRDGDEAETLISSEQALIGAGAQPVASAKRVIWSDRQQGDWDLVLHRM
jgi:hypothetical protein